MKTVLKTKTPIKWGELQQFEDEIFMRIASKTFNDIKKQVEVYAQYYRIENGLPFAVLVEPTPDIIPFDQLNQMSDALITDPDENRINTDKIEMAFLLGALNIIDQNSTLGTSAADWEMIQVDEDSIHSNQVLG